MKLSKRITSIVLAMIMILSTSSVFAADYDLKIIETGESKSFLDWIFDDAVFLDVMYSEGQYLVECGGKYYKAEDVIEKSTANPNAELDELVKDLEPVAEEPDELKVVSVSAINANTILVTFEGIEEPVEIELEEALVHGENEVTFEYEGQTFTVTVNYKDPEVVEEEKAEAIKNAIEKINAIGNPATLTLEDEAKVVAARTAVNAAKELGAVDADIVNLDHLIAAETQINALKEALNEKETAIQEANVALTNLPLEVTLEDKEQVEEARELVNKALELGAEENDFVNLWKLTDAEAKIAELEEEAAEAEAVQAVIDAINALPEEITLEDAEAVADARAAYDALTEEQQKLVTNVDVLKAAEAKIAELEEEAAKKVTVTKIVKVEKNRVTVEIKPYDKDRFGEEIEILDNNGNKVAVKPVDIAAGDTTVYFEFVTPFAADYEFKGVWKIAGIEIDFDLKAKLEAFVDAGNDQIKLYKALTDLGIENVKMENMPVYADKHDDFLAELEEDETELTVEAIQAWINKVNAGTISDAESRAIAKKVNDAIKAENDVALLAALQDPAFVRVNPEWLGDYKTEIGTDGTQDTVEKIQAKIDKVNNAKVDTAIGEIANNVDKEELLEIKNLIEKYATPDEKGEQTKATKAALKAIDVQLAVADVRAATTPTTLKAKLTALDNLLDDADKFMEEYVDTNGKAYLKAIKEFKATDESEVVTGVLNVDNVKAAITSVNEAVEGRLSIEEFKAVDDPNYDSTQAGIIHLMGYKVKINVSAAEGETSYTTEDTESIVVDFYKGKTLLGKLTFKGKPGEGKYTPGPTVWGTIDVYGDYVSTSWDQEWYGELTDIPDKAVVTVKYDDGIVAKKEKVAEFATDNIKPFFVEAVNRAETVEEMDAALLKLAEIGNYDYLNVPKADRLYVAEQVLEARNEIEDTKKFATYNDLTNALTGDDGVITKYNADLEAVNDLKADSPIADVIKALSFDEGFAKMSVADKAEIAEAFFLGLEFDEKEDSGKVSPAFRTLAAVKAAAGL